MGREIKRVALDFEHEGPWPGYLRRCDNSECEGCLDCENQEPPEGDAYQVWETVSEGSPISPPFADVEACATWLVENEQCAPEAARKFIEDGWAPSFIGTPFGLFKGVQMAAGVDVHLTHLAPEGSHAAGTRIRHREYGIEGTVAFRVPLRSGEPSEYYCVTWDKGLPNLVAGEPEVNPDEPMQAMCRQDGFDVLASASAT